MDYYRRYDEDYPIGCHFWSYTEYNQPDVGFITIGTTWVKYLSWLLPSVCEFSIVTTSKVIYAPAICLDIIEMIRYKDGKDEEEIERMR